MKSSSEKLLIIVVIVLIILNLTTLSYFYFTGKAIKPIDESESEPEYALVTRIIDGDTIEIEVENPGDNNRVRLCCIDTPEMGEKYYKEASDYLSDLILGKEIRMERDVSEVGKYGRLIRYIYLDDVFINEQIVRNGWAVAYPYYPDTKLCPQIQEAEKLAKQEELGIWSTDIEVAIPGVEGVCDCSGDNYNCADFTNQKEAQDCFDSCSSYGDVHKLDRDGDGVVCESLR